MAVTKETLDSRAKNQQEEKLVEFGATALAFAGGKFKHSEFFEGGKRFERLWVKGDAVVAISATTVGIDVTIKFTCPQDRFRIATAYVFEVMSSVRIPEGTMAQLMQIIAAELKRANGSQTPISFRAYCTGVNAVQGAAADDDGFAGPQMPFNQALLPAGGDVVTPMDFQNPGEITEIRLTGLAGVTLAESFSGVINIGAHAHVFDCVKG